MASALKTPSPKPKAPLWRRLLPLIGLCLLAWILSQLDRAAMADAFARVSLPTLFIAVGSFMFNLVIKAIRWWRLLAAQGRPLPFPVAFAAFMAAQFYAQVTLGRLGEFYRAEPLIEAGVPAGEALASCVVDRLFDIFTVLCLGAVLGALVAHRTDVAWLAAAVMFVGVVVLTVLVYAYRNPQVLRGPRAALMRQYARLESVPVVSKVARVFQDLVLGTLSLLRPGPVLEACCWTAVAWVGYYGALWTLAGGMGLGVGRDTLTAASSLAALSGLLPVTVSGLGARELIYQQILGTAGVGPEEAVVVALLHLGIMSGCAIFIAGLGVFVRARQQRLATA